MVPSAAKIAATRRESQGFMLSSRRGRRPHDRILPTVLIGGSSRVLAAFVTKQTKDFVRIHLARYRGAE